MLEFGNALALSTPVTDSVRLTETNPERLNGSVQMIIESLGLVACRENRRELQVALSYLVGPTRVEAGCLRCQLCQDVSDPNILHFESVWKTKDDLLRHLRSEIYKQLLILLELSVEPPSVQFHTVSVTYGLEFVHANRQQEPGQTSEDPASEISRSEKEKTT